MRTEKERVLTTSKAEYHMCVSEDKAYSLVATDYKDAPTITRIGGGTELETVVRRLTPQECALLQGFPSNWCDIGDWTDSKGKLRKEADAPKYKALGNSCAQPFWFWLLRRISAEYETPATLGSLFDGIGAFPYAWVRCNGTDSVRWASEVDDFCIAVTTKHFGDEDKGIVGDIKEYL